MQQDPLEISRRLKLGGICATDVPLQIPVGKLLAKRIPVNLSFSFESLLCAFTKKKASCYLPVFERPMLSPQLTNILHPAQW